MRAGLAHRPREMRRFPVCVDKDTCFKQIHNLVFSSVGTVNIKFTSTVCNFRIVHTVFYTVLLKRKVEKTLWTLQYISSIYNLHCGKSGKWSIFYYCFIFMYCTVYICIFLQYPPPKPLTKKESEDIKCSTVQFWYCLH